MKEVRAYIESHKLEDVSKELQSIGITGLTAITAVGLGRGLKDGEARTVTIGSSHFLSCMKLEVICNDSLEETVIAAITKAGWTGEKGHGMIFVATVERAIPINPLQHGLDRSTKS